VECGDQRAWLLVGDGLWDTVDRDFEGCDWGGAAVLGDSTGNKDA